MIKHLNHFCVSAEQENDTTYCQEMIPIMTPPTPLTLTVMKSDDANTEYEHVVDGERNPLRFTVPRVGANKSEKEGEDEGEEKNKEYFE